jgi:hypothetical protein
MGSMLVNRALLEEVTVDTLDTWMEKFPHLQGKKLIVRNQLNTQSKGSPVRVQPPASIKGSIAKANTEFANFMNKLKILPKPLTLTAIFGMDNAYIAQALLKYERCVEPLLEKFFYMHQNRFASKNRKLSFHIGQVFFSSFQHIQRHFGVLVRTV